MKPLVKLVCASCGTTVGRIGRNGDGAMVRERIQRNRYFHAGGSAPHGFPSTPAVAAILIDKFEDVIEDPRAVLRSHEQAGETEMADLFVTHRFFGYATICKKCTAAIGITQGDIIKALNAANELQKVRRAVLHPQPST